MAGPDAGGAAGRLAIIAGRGRLPRDVAEAARQAGERPLILALDGEAAADWPGFDTIRIGLGDFAPLETALRRHGIDRIVLSGGVERRPEWRELRPTLRHILKLPSVVRTLLGGGDDKVLRMVIALIERDGRRVVGAHEIVPGLVATDGPLTRTSPSSADRLDIAAGRAAALALGRLDVGQGAVSVGGRVIALEGAEGTDAMLHRVAELRSVGRISQRRGGALVKFCKPEQDERADLPSIGPSTVRNAVAAGLAGIAVEAGRSLVLDRDRTVAAADAAGLFVLGVMRADDAGDGVRP